MAYVLFIIILTWNSVLAYYLIRFYVPFCNNSLFFTAKQSTAVPYKFKILVFTYAIKRESWELVSVDIQSH
jgi:hypothetical protein